MFARTSCGVLLAFVISTHPESCTDYSQLCFPEPEALLFLVVFPAGCTTEMLFSVVPHLILDRLACILSYVLLTESLVF